MTVLLLLLVSLAGARELTLDQALSLAESSSPQVQAADHAADAATARARSVRSYLLPTVHVSANALWWSEPLEVMLLEGDPCADLDPPMDGICQDMVGDLASEPMLLREAQTQQAEVRVVQPLSGMYGIARGYEAARSAAAAVGWDAAQARSDAGLAVVDAYLTALETAAMGQVADQGVELLVVHQRQVAALRAQELVGRAEVLQVEASLADARLGRERARVGRALLERRLALLVGEPEAVQPAPVEVSAVPPLQLSDAALRELALGAPNVQALAARGDAARADRDRLQADRLPQVAAVASAKRSWGLGSLAASEEVYAGLVVEWDVWAWGRAHYAAQEAAANAHRAEAGVEGLRQGAVLRAEAARADVELARTALASAEAQEAHAAELARILEARFGVGDATTADVLEAQVELSSARADAVRARFAGLRAAAELQAALGLPLEPSAGVVLP